MVPIAVEPDDPDRPIFFLNGDGGVGTKFRLSRSMRRAADDAPIENKANVQPTFTICFGEGEPLAGRPVIEGLSQMIGKVKVAVARIGRAFV
jgi:hypothetical protein